MTKDGLQPESFTQQAVIEPLLAALGHDWATEAGGLSGGRTMVADYTISLRDHPDIDSTRLLVEAEPINKDLDSREHGIGQVRDWLSQREFESDFGFATDGLRWAFVRYDPDSYTHNVIEEVDLQPVFLAVFQNQVGKREPPTEAVFDADREQVTRLLRTFEYQNFVSIAGEARQVIKQKQEEITDEFYDDYIRYVFGIVNEDETTPRSLIGDGVVKPEGASEEDARLFAVELMNRLIFIKFLEDKAIVQPDLLRTVKETYNDGTHMGSLYDSFLKRLFYDVMNEKPEKRSPQVKNVDLFADIPYLNGGLFRPTIEGEDFEEGDFDVRNSVLESIIDLLERYSFSAGGAPTDLDPSVLGNVFEKTINYITSDNADTNKELGAYYTPSEITRFCAEETVRPALLDRFQNVLVEERDWPEAEAERYDSVYELIEDLPGSWKLISALLAEVDEFRVVDPACGSGHFLTSVLEEIVNVRKALYAQNENYPQEYKLKKTTVLNNIYGVDLMGPAVEIGKLRLWLSIISELDEDVIDDLDDDDLALPNIVFNLREGNSLIGYTGFPETNGDDQYRLGSFSEDSVRDRYQGIIDEIEKHEQAFDSETAEKHRSQAFEKLRNAREELIDDIHADFVDAGIDDITPEEVRELEPFNWVLEFAEVYADGGFDVAVGNPPWDVLRTNRDDFFSRYDPTFRTRMPEDKDAKMEELLEDPEIEEGWEQYNQQMQARADYFNNSDGYELQSPVVDGKEVTSENELSALFLERVYNIARDDAYVSLILPNVIFTSSTAKDLRLHLLNNTTVDSLLHFENHGIFEGLHNQYRFGILTFQNGGQTDELRGIFLENTIDVIEKFEEKTVKIPRKVLTDYSPEAALFPQISSRGDTDPENEVGVLSKLLDHPSLDEPFEDSWNVSIHRELDRTYDADRFVESPDEGDYSVLGGKNIYQFVYDDRFLDVEPPEFWSVDEGVSTELSAKSRIREKEVRNLKTALYNEFDGTGSQKGFVNNLLEDARGEPLSVDDVLLDCTTPRIAFRDIGNTTNERTFIATVLPAGVVCHSKLRTFRPHETVAQESDLDETPLRSIYQRRFTNEEMFAALGLINSLAFDYLMRTKIDNTLVAYKVRESQVPRLTDGDEWFDYIWTRAARLNCYGDEFESLRDELGITSATGHQERKILQAEMDAGAMLAYGLNRNEVEHMLDNFGRVKSPRLMDDEYFEMVLEKYDDLAS
ncbi:Eco57I restriction-modification methylase domain-containing protein [Haloarcula sediminis]|uniref:Eco57I restriction-modification methylase domain-containing protein n=1 Tax=Haloarcula sediminis TaxID=3111777 RepID=UPI002D76D55A|nr:DNA methyltransferase [Haloarcula sp. CK38]